MSICIYEHFICLFYPLFQAASPACTELEMITTDWLGKMISLPEQFLHCGKGKGGGVIQVLPAI
jgi:hypothetical protein